MPTDSNPHAEPVIVATYQDRGEAEVSQAHLRGSGIESFIVDEIEGGLLNVQGEGQIGILVHAQDADTARQILAPDPDT